MLRLALAFGCVLTVFGSVFSVDGKQDDNRIINGEDADIEDFPYTLFFYTLLPNGGHTLCGAVVVDEEWALTAAHCVHGGDPTRFRLHTNSTRIAGGVQGRGHFVSKAIVHPSYAPDASGVTADYDIALLKVNPSFVLGPGTLPINLPDQDEQTPVGANGTITGWGIKGGRPSAPTPVLQKATLAISDHRKCVELFANAPVPTRGIVTERMICAQGSGSGCVGDSGGPLAVNGTLVGLVSWGSDTCSGYPNVFTRVAYFRRWIKQHAGF